MSEEIELCHTQLGFRPAHGKKRIVVPDVPEAESIFGSRVYMVFEQNEFSKYPLNSDQQHKYTYRDVLQRKRTDFGTWLVGDISELQDNGVYQARLGSTLSPTFVIRDDVYRRILPLCITYFRAQSCGRDVPGWHEACHLDDGYIVEEDRYVDAAGGWHDAGDFRKWATSISLNAISLLIGNRLWKGREERLGLSPGVFLSEAMQGYEYFLNIQEEDGSLLHNIGGGMNSVHDNMDCRYTDNIPESGDERRIHPGTATPPGKFTTLYALYAEELAEEDPEKAERALSAARRSREYDFGEGDPSMEAVQWRAWGELVLYRVTGEEEYKKQALESLEQILQMQVTEYVGGQQTTRGFWRAHPTEPGYHRKHVGNDYHIWVMGEFIETFPEHPDVERWKDAVELWVDEYVQVFAARNPFGLLPYAMYETKPEDNEAFEYRHLGDGLMFRYFLAGCHYMSNARYSMSAVALAKAAKVLGRPSLMSDAYRLLEWVHGANPWQISTMNGVGVKQPDPLSFQMGRIPGGVTLGPGGDEQDMPAYMHPRACRDEYYGYQTSQFMWATLALEDMDWEIDGEE